MKSLIIRTLNREQPCYLVFKPNYAFGLKAQLNIAQWQRLGVMNHGLRMRPAGANEFKLPFQGESLFNYLNAKGVAFGLNLIVPTGRYDKNYQLYVLKQCLTKFFTFVICREGFKRLFNKRINYQKQVLKKHGQIIY